MIEDAELVEPAEPQLVLVEAPDEEISVITEPIDTEVIDLLPVGPQRRRRITDAYEGVPPALPRPTIAVG